MPASLRIGISGWTYTPWRGVFFPKDLPQKLEQEFAVRTFNSIEVNGTFYSMQRPSSFQTWYEKAPEDFVYAIKGGRFITHLRRLKDCEKPLANFFAQGILLLKKKLGPILWQLPPNLQFDAERVEAFLRLLPQDTHAAAALAKSHDSFMKKARVSFDIEAKKRPVRHAMEVRHETFQDEAFIKLLRKYNVALVVADTAGRWPLMEDVTADFIYARLHGDEELYASGYTKGALDAWAKKIRAWAKGGDAVGAKRVGPPTKKRSSRDVFVYFDNDVKVHAPFDANGLAKRLGVSEVVLTPGVKLAQIDEKVRDNWPAVDEKGKKISAKARSMGLSKKRLDR